VGIPSLQGADRGCEPAGGANSSAGPQEVAELEVRERLQSMLRNVDGRPLGGDGAGGPGAPTINAKKR
jgi:hypothetical protein